MRIKVGKQGTINGGGIMSEMVKRTLHFIQVIRMPEISISNTSTVEDCNEIEVTV